MSAIIVCVLYFVALQRHWLSLSAICFDIKYVLVIFVCLTRSCKFGISVADNGIGLLDAGEMILRNEV